MDWTVKCIRVSGEKLYHIVAIDGAAAYEIAATLFKMFDDGAIICIIENTDKDDPTNISGYKVAKRPEDLCIQGRYDNWE